MNLGFGFHCCYAAGCHGVGKTAIAEYFESSGFAVLDEGFLDAPPTLLHPQSLLLESTWVCAWFERLMNEIQARRKANKPPAIMIADRSPLSAVFYTRSHGHLLEPLIRRYVEELREAAHVVILTAHVTVEAEALWRRINDRLEREPHRYELNEDR